MPRRNLEIILQSSPLGFRSIGCKLADANIRSRMDELTAIFASAARREIDLDAVLQIAGQELLHYARVLLGPYQTAEDALQDTLVALLQEGTKAAQINCPRAWLFTVLRRKALIYRKTEPQSLAREFGEA